MTSTITKYPGSVRTRRCEVQFARRQPLTDGMRGLLERISEMDLADLDCLHADLGLDALVQFPPQAVAYHSDSKQFAVAVIVYRAGPQELLVWLTRAPGALEYTGALYSGADIQCILDILTMRNAPDCATPVAGFGTLYADADGIYAGAEIDGLRMSVTSRAGYTARTQYPLPVLQMFELLAMNAEAAKAVDAVTAAATA